MKRTHIEKAKRERDEHRDTYYICTRATQIHKFK